MLRVSRHAKGERVKQIQVAVRRILLEEWDPIGVRGFPQAADEYDLYIDGVYRLLASGASPKAVAEHLCTIERERMGFSEADPGRRLPVATNLCRLDVSVEQA